MRAKGKQRKELVFGVIFVPRLPRTADEHGRRIKPRPSGSWTSRVYEDGVCIGEWLNFQYDPDVAEYADFYKSFERFRPRNADWVWASD